MKIAITGGKGGTGKSTVSTAIAYELAKEQKVLLVDLDVDCPNDHLILNSKRGKIKDVFQPVPIFNFEKCIKCGKCASVCKRDSIAFAKNKFPAFVPDNCIGCKACISVCPTGAISEGKKKIGKIYKGKNYGVSLITGELKIGELASGEMVVETRKVSEDFEADITLLDSAAGIGCPVIASIMGTDYVIAVTEPTPSALSDLKRVLHVVEHFNIPYGIVINKSDLSNKFCKKIKEFASRKKIKILGQIPYQRDFVESTVNMMPINAYNPKYSKYYKEIIKNAKTKKM